MASVAESIGYGATLHIDDGSANAYVQAFNLNSFMPPSPKLGTVESKRLDTPSSVIVEVPTMLKAGDATLKFQFTQAGFTRVNAFLLAKTKHNYKFTIPDDTSTTVIIAPAYVTQVKIDNVEPDKITEMEVTLTVCGPTS